MIAWMLPSTPVARLARFRCVLYLFVIYDLLFITRLGFTHGDTPEDLYSPLLIRTLFHLPAPSPGYVRVLAGIIILSALVAATGKLPRLAGWICCLGMLDWLSNVFSYGKIDHDHFALVVALAVLPTAGRISASDQSSSARIGWAARAIGLAVIATYFLSAIAKIRFGGWGWPQSAIFTWAFVRRGTPLAQQLLAYPVIVKISQWGLFIAELLSPLLLFVKPRWRYAGVVGFAIFHLSTWFLIEIHFLPLAVCLLIFLPLEQIKSPQLLLSRLLPARPEPKVAE